MRVNDRKLRGKVRVVVMLGAALLGMITLSGCVKDYYRLPDLSTLPPGESLHGTVADDFVPA